MATYRYRFTGESSVHLPLHGVTAEPGQEVECDIPITHPDFERVSEAGEKEGKAKKHR